MTTDTPTAAAKCELCGEPMPPNEQMFKYHGYSSNCPKPPLPKLTAAEYRGHSLTAADHRAAGIEKMARAHCCPHGRCINIYGDDIGLCVVGGLAIQRMTAALAAWEAHCKEEQSK